MGVQPDSESGQGRNFQLLFSLSESVFELDLAGGSAAELDVGIEAAPQLGAFPVSRGLVSWEGCWDHLGSVLPPEI